MLIAFANRFFSDWPAPPTSPRHDLCFTHDPAELALADAVVFHLASPGFRPTFAKSPGQLWVAWCMESRVMCPPLQDDDLLAQFDLTMTYERSSDVWCPYFGPGTLASYERPVSAAPIRAANPVVWLCRNGQDRAGRRAYAAELMDHVPVDSFGEVLRNRPERIGEGGARLALYRHYKFTLAFENSYSADYVTEKLYDPIGVGSVPVYRGTETVADLAPHPGSYIDARDFSSAAELGRYLAHLDAHDEEYQAFHAWRAEGPTQAFRAMAEALEEPFWRLADLIERRSRRSP
jgi:alpha-1,3-fucosyltransferase 10